MSDHSQEILVDDDPELRELLSAFLDGPSRSSAERSDRASARKAPQQSPSDVLVIDITPARDGQSARFRVLHPRSDLSALILEVVDSDDGARLTKRAANAPNFRGPAADARNLFAKVLDVRQTYGVFAPSNAAPKGRTASFDGWTLDVAMRRLAYQQGESVALPATEFALLLAFLDHPRRVLTRHQLVGASCVSGHAFSTRTLDVYVSRLRRRLSTAHGGAELIATRRGQGYVFNADVVFA